MPSVTRQTGALADKEAEEQAKVNAANAKIVKMNQVKTKMSNLQTKLECAVGQLRGTFMDYRDTKDDEDATEERDIAVIVIYKNWDKMETIATSLSEAIEELAEIVSTSEDGTEIS